MGVLAKKNHLALFVSVPTLPSQNGGSVVTHMMTCRIMCPKQQTPELKARHCRDELYFRFLISSEICLQKSCCSVDIKNLVTLRSETFGHLGDLKYVRKTSEHLSTASDLLICCWTSSDTGGKTTCLEVLASRRLCIYQ